MKHKNRFWTQEETQALEGFLRDRQDIQSLKPAKLIALLEKHMKPIARPGHKKLTRIQIVNKISHLMKNANIHQRDKFLMSINRVTHRGPEDSPPLNAPAINPAMQPSTDPEYSGSSYVIGAQQAGKSKAAVVLTGKIRNNGAHDSLSGPRYTSAAKFPLSSSIESNTVDVQLEPVPPSMSWETKLARYFHQLASARGYDAPPDHDWVVEKMNTIFELLSLGVRRFQDAHRCPPVLVHTVLPSDLVRLAGLLVPSATHDALPTYLRAICAQSPTARTHLPISFAAAAIFDWVFCHVFEEDVELEHGTFFADALALLAHG